MKRRRTESEGDNSSDTPTYIIRGTPEGILRRIQNVYANRLLTDVTLVVEGVSYPAHGFILCLSSDVFETMLMNYKRSDSHQGVIELQEIPQCVDVFPVFLQYLYTGEITVDFDIIIPILMLAVKYNVENLTEFCINYMCKILTEAAKNGLIVTWFQYLLSLNHPKKVNAAYFCKIWQDNDCIKFKPPLNKFFKACKNFIKWNIDKCVDCFNTFQCDVLVGLLQQSDLVVDDEIQLFKYVEGWINYQAEKKLIECNDSDTVKEYKISLIENVMSYIRYPMIPPRRLPILFMEPILKEHGHFFIDKMTETMYYNMIKIEKQTSADYILACTPRLYTCSQWGGEFRVYSYTLDTLLPLTKEITTNRYLFERSEEMPEKAQWNVELFLNGLWYDKALWTSGSDSLELPEVILKKVRATIELKLREYEKKVSFYARVAILVYGRQIAITHVVSVVQKVVLFTEDQLKITIDDFMDYEELHRVGAQEAYSQFGYYTFGALKVHIVITPVALGVTDIQNIAIGIQHVHFQIV